MDIAGLVGQVVFGLIVGAIAKFIMPGRDGGGIFITAIIGMVGSIIGTMAGRFFFGAYYAAGWIMSILGAILVLALYRAFAGRSA
jgi:uncharacterized membrane protein YeaQ/YmgE (transglycosylase-associated protein family)